MRQPPKHTRPSPPGTAEDPIDAFFDSRADEADAGRLAAALRSDVRTAGDFVRTQRLISMLKEPVEGPDLTDAILARFEQRRRFGARIRRPWIGGRLAACVGLVVGAGALWVIERTTHPAPPLAPTPLAAGTRNGVPEALRPSTPIPQPRNAGPDRFRLTMGRVGVRQLQAPAAPLVLPSGSGGSSGVPALAWARTPANLRESVRWGRDGAPLLGIPPLEPWPTAQSSLIRLPALSPRGED
jgi:hypothetical protein